jgi:hypothetical protein
MKHTMIQGLSACSLGLSATSQQYFSLRTNQPPATSRNQPAVLFSQNKPAPAISHQPTEQAVCLLSMFLLTSSTLVHARIIGNQYIKFIFVILMYTCR